MEYRFVDRRVPWQYLVSPIIYSGIIPAMLLDFWFELYQRICFPIYGIALVKREEYIRIDRQRLSYLPWWDKLNCTYCGYVNGVLRLCGKIAAETEAYWCKIKHKPSPGYREPEYMKDFLPYGDAKALRRFTVEGRHGIEGNNPRKRYFEEFTKEVRDGFEKIREDISTAARDFRDMHRK